VVAGKVFVPPRALARARAVSWPATVVSKEVEASSGVPRWIDGPPTSDGIRGPSRAHAAGRNRSFSWPHSPIGPYLVKLFAASDAAKSPLLGRKLRVFYSAYTIKLEGASGHAFAGTMEAHCPTSYDN